ncbi:MAG: hypothetical protein EPO21_15275 [Chloroflexota bacterium]|nr:MAG: hypothetical protein EPO21_15275 [Chloroflexota bacterium]
MCLRRGRGNFNPRISRIPPITATRCHGRIGVASPVGARRSTIAGPAPTLVSVNWRFAPATAHSIGWLRATGKVAGASPRYRTLPTCRKGARLPSAGAPRVEFHSATVSMKIDPDVPELWIWVANPLPEAGTPFTVPTKDQVTSDMHTAPARGGSGLRTSVKTPSARCSTMGRVTSASTVSFSTAGSAKAGVAKSNRNTRITRSTSVVGFIISAPPAVMVAIRQVACPRRWYTYFWGRSMHRTVRTATGNQTNHAIHRLLTFLVQAEPYFVPPLALVPLFVPNPYRPAAAAAAILSCLLRWPVLHRVLRRTPADVPLGFTILGAIVGTAVSPLLDISLERLWGYLAVVALFYLIATRRSDANLRGYMVWIVGGPLLLAVLLGALTLATRASAIGPLHASTGDQYLGLGRLVAQQLSGAHWVYAQVGRLFPMVSQQTPNPNGIAGLLIVAVPFALAGSLRAPGWRRAGWVMASGVLLLVTVATGSRGGLLALGAGVLGVLAAQWRRPWISLWLLGLPAITLVLGWLGAQVLPWLDVPGTGELGRVDLWHTSFYMVQDFPLTGVGLGAFPAVFQALYAGDPKVTNPHNLFLQTYLDLGVLGLIGLLWIVLWGLRVAFSPRVADSPVRSWIRTGLAGAWLAFLVHGSFEASSATVWASGAEYHGIVSPVPWALAALSAVLADNRTGASVEDQLVHPPSPLRFGSGGPPCPPGVG